MLQRLAKNNIAGIDVKKLKGRDAIFRIRKGRVRVLYRVDRRRNVYILAIERRNDHTYNF